MRFAVLLSLVGLPLLAALPAAAASDVIFKIWNDTHVPITAIYDKDSRQSNWGVNDLLNPIPPGHFFYIRFKQNSYAHCPGMLHDARLVFANGDVKMISKVPVCQVDVHVNKP